MRNDQELLSRFTDEGDQSAFATLVERHGHLVYAAARRQCAPEAEDVTQAVFILLANKARELGGQKSLAGWLHRTTAYCCNNARKLAARRRRHEQEAAMQRSAWEIDAASNRPANDETLLPLLDDAIRRLPEHYREVVLLRYLEGRSYDEVGQLLGLSVDAASKRATRGLQKLRDFFAGKGHVTTGAALAALLVHESSLRAAEGVIAAAGSVGAAGTGTAGAGAIAAAAGKGMMTGTMKAMSLVAVVTVALAGIVMAVALLAGEAPPASAPASPESTVAPVTGMVNGAVPQPQEETAIPGSNTVASFNLLLNAEAAAALAASPLQVDAPAGFFAIHRGTAADVLTALRAARDEGQIVLYDRQMQHTRWPSGWPVDRNYSVHIPQFWNDFRLDEQRFTLGLTWSNRPGATIQQTPEGVRLRLQDEDISTFIQEYSQEPRERRNGRAAVDYTAVLAPGEAVALLGDYQPIRGRQFVTATVFHVYRANEAQFQRMRRVRGSDIWLNIGPGGGRILADRAIAWAGDRKLRSQDVAEQWTRRLENGALVRLMAVGRPSTWPFCWWDADGNPVAQDWTRLGAGLDLPQAVVFSVTWPEGESGLQQPKFFEPGETYAVLPEDQQVTLWVSGGEWQEERVTPGDEVRIGDGMVRFEREMDAGSMTLALLRGDLGPDVEVWIDAVDRSGQRIRGGSGRERAVTLVTSKTQRWSSQSENLDVKTDDIDHYILRWRMRQPATFEGFANTPTPLPPPIEVGRQ